MIIWGISDLHLSFSTNKPMDQFGQNWVNHAEKMQKSWDSKVNTQDIVLCPGDLSWAINEKEVIADLDWISKRPGTKIFLKGNHDYWWSSISKIRKILPSNCLAIQNDFIDLDHVMIAGSKGSDIPDSSANNEQEEKLYKREQIRLEISLQKARKHSQIKPMIALMHYPPLTKNATTTTFSDILSHYKVEICLYGHLHGKNGHAQAREGLIDGITYKLISCDYLDFAPVKIYSDRCLI